MSRQRDTWIHGILAAGLFITGTCVRAQELRPAGDNAALDYWKASALMRTPRTVEELEIAQFVNTVIVELPPRFFSVRPDIAQWLLGERAVIAALADGALKPNCDFAVRRGNSPFLNLEHLPYMSALTQYGLAVACAYEYAENFQGVAGIYYSLLKLAHNLDQDNNLSSGLRAAEMLQMIVSDMEGFMSRDPSAPSVAILVDFFRRVQSPVFHLGAYLNAEGGRFGRWLLEDPAQVEKKLAMLYGRATRKPAIDKLVTLSPERKERRLQDWVMNYEARMIRLANAVEEPYSEAITILRQLDEEKNEMKDNEDAPGVNPLIPLLVPSMEKVYQRFKLAEAQFDMLYILTMAALFRSNNGRWPVSISEVQGVSRAPLPDDPFAGKPFYFKLVHLRPRIITRVPRWMADEEKLVFSLNLAERHRNDGNRYEEALKIYQRSTLDPAMSDTQQPVRQ